MTLQDPVILICHIDSTSKSPCTHITYSSLHQIALLSSGNGSVLVFDTSEISDSHLNPVLILDGVHGKEGTSSCYIDYSNNDSQRMEFLSCGKDGRLCRFLLHKSTNEWKCENVDAMTCTSGSLESVTLFDYSFFTDKCDSF